MVSKSSVVTSRKVPRPVGPGVVHQDVEGWLCGDCRRGGVVVGDIQHQCLGAAACITDLACRGFELIHGARDHHDVRACFSQSGGGGKADAASGAGHQRAPAVEPE